MTSVPLAATTGAVVMAAGAGRRMGNVPKSLLRRDGEPLLLRQIRLLDEAGVERIVVVLGHHAERIGAVLARAQASPPPRRGMARVHWVTNPVPDRGTGSSLRCGLAALPEALRTWLVVLGDQPLLETGDVRGVLRAWTQRAPGTELILPQHAGRLGHPIAFGSLVRNAVLHAGDTAGVREWRRAHSERVQVLELTHARCTTDVDTPADVEHLREACNVSLDPPLAE